MLRTGTKSIRTWIKNTGIGIDLDPDTTVLFDLDPDPSFDLDPNLTYSTLGAIFSLKVTFQCFLLQILYQVRYRYRTVASTLPPEPATEKLIPNSHGPTWR